MEWNNLITAVTAIAGGAGIVWGQALWLSRQFSTVRELVYQKTDKLERSIVDKLEYHERHDDERFARVRDDLWEIRVTNAARDGGLVKKSPSTEGGNI